MSVFYFPRRIAEPKIMEAIEMKTFENLSVQNYKRWFIPLVDHALEWAGPPRKKTILDVACGPGFLVRELANRSSSFQMTGIDTSKYGIRLAKKNCKGFTNVRFLTASVYRLPFSSESFNLVICKDSFHHFNNPERALREMFRILKKRGLVYIQDLRRDLPQYLWRRCIPPDSVLKKLQFYSARASYTKTEMQKLLRKLGIARFRIHTRKLTSSIKERYTNKGIDPRMLKESFQSRYVLIAWKK